MEKIKTPFYFGGAASCTAAIIVHPLDLTKVRLQNAKGNNASMLGTMLNIIRTEGPIKLYAGLSASILRQATYSTVRLGGYEALKQALLQKEKSNVVYFKTKKKKLINNRSIGIAAVVMCYNRRYCRWHMRQSWRCSECAYAKRRSASCPPKKKLYARS